jgi:hypothetical protein
VEALVLFAPVFTPALDLSRHPALVEPHGRSLVEAVPPELVQHENAAALEQTCDLVHRRAEVGDVVKRTACDDGAEAAPLGKVLEAHPLEDRPLGRVWVDGRDVIAGCGERSRELTGAAADLEHARGRRRDVRDHERGRLHR